MDNNNRVINPISDIKDIETERDSIPAAPYAQPTPPPTQPPADPINLTPVFPTVPAQAQNRQHSFRLTTFVVLFIIAAFAVGGWYLSTYVFHPATSTTTNGSVNNVNSGDVKLKNFDVPASDVHYSINFYSDATLNHVGGDTNTTAVMYSLDRPDMALQLSVNVTATMFTTESCNKGLSSVIDSIDTKYGSLIVCSVIPDKSVLLIPLTVNKAYYTIRLTGNKVTDFASIKSNVLQIVNSFEVK